MKSLLTGRIPEWRITRVTTGFSARIVPRGRADFVIGNGVIFSPVDLQLARQIVSRLDENLDFL